MIVVAKGQDGTTVLRDREGIIIVNPETIQEMRNWIADCEWQDMDADDIAKYPAAEICKGIHFHYDGDIRQFQRDARVT